MDSTSSSLPAGAAPLAAESPAGVAAPANPPPTGVNPYATPSPSNQAAGAPGGASDTMGTPASPATAAPHDKTALGDGDFPMGEMSSQAADAPPAAGSPPVYPPGGMSYPPSGPGYPAAGPGHPGAGPGYPAAGPGHPGAGPGYPGAGPGYPPAGPPAAGPGYPPAGPPPGMVYPPAGQPPGMVYPPGTPASEHPSHVTTNIWAGSTTSAGMYHNKGSIPVWDATTIEYTDHASYLSYYDEPKPLPYVLTGSRRHGPIVAMASSLFFAVLFIIVGAAIGPATYFLIGAGVAMLFLGGIYTLFIYLMHARARRMHQERLVEDTNIALTIRAGGVPPMPAFLTCKFCTLTRVSRRIHHAVCIRPAHIPLPPIYACIGRLGFEYQPMMRLLMRKEQGF